MNRLSKNTEVLKMLMKMTGDDKFWGFLQAVS